MTWLAAEVVVVVDAAVVTAAANLTTVSEVLRFYAVARV